MHKTCCVLCGEETEKNNEYYIKESGQLCKECFNDLYE